MVPVQVTRTPSRRVPTGCRGLSCSEGTPGGSYDRIDKLDSTLHGTRLLASGRYVIAAAPSRLDIRTIDAAGSVGSSVTVSRVPFEAVT